MLAANFFVCSFMTGLIWIIQLLHYPAFMYIDQQNFTHFHQIHSNRISFIVIPIMILELLTSLALFHQQPNNTILFISFIMLVGIWICTFAISVPLHKSLSTYKDIKKIKQLIYTNWPRTILWSLRSLILLWLFNNDSL